MKNLSIKEIIEHPQAGLVACLLAGFILLFTLGKTFDRWSTDWSLAHQTVKTTATLSYHPKNDLLAKLPEAHLFGQNRLLSETSGIPITSLQLQVTGIIKGTHNEVDSKVIIAMGGQSGKVYHPGDTLAQGVRIDTITNDAVILENSGQLEKLPLPRRKHARMDNREVG